MIVPLNVSVQELEALVSLSLNYLSGSDTHELLDAKIDLEEISALLDKTDVDPKLRTPEKGMSLDEDISGVIKNTHNFSFGRALRAIPGIVPSAYIPDSLSNDDVAPDYLKEYFKGSEVEPLNIRELTDMFYGTVDQFHQTVCLIKKGIYNTCFISLTNPDNSYPRGLTEKEALMIGRSIKTPLVGIAFNKEFLEEDQIYSWIITPCVSSIDDVYNNFINVFLSVVALVIKELTKENVQVQLFHVDGVNYNLELDFTEFKDYDFNSIKPLISFVEAS